MTYAADAAPPFYHGTRADLKPGDFLTPGFDSNYGERRLSWIYFSGTLDAAIWGCELARGEGRERIYIVEPTGPFEDLNSDSIHLPMDTVSLQRWVNVYCHCLRGKCILSLFEGSLFEGRHDSTSSSPEFDPVRLCRADGLTTQKQHD